MNKKLAQKIAKEVGCITLQFLFVNINLFGFLSPVGLPFAFARIFYGGNIFSITLSYFIASMLRAQNVYDITIVFYEVVMLALYFFSKEYLKTNKKIILIYASLIISNALSLYFSLYDFNSLWHEGLNLLCELVLLLYFYYLIKFYNKKFVFFKFSCWDYLLFSIFVLLLSVSVFGIPLFHDYVGFILMVILLIFLARIFPVDKYFITTLIFSLGSVVIFNSYVFLTFTGISCVIIALIKDFNKYIFSILTGAVFLIILLIINFFTLFYIISSIFAVFLMLIFPNKWLVRLSQVFDFSANNLIFKCINDRQISEVSGGLFLMSNTLKKMQDDFKYLLVGKINRSAACRELTSDIIGKACKRCENYAVCFMQNIDKQKMIEDLLWQAIEKGQLDIGELTVGLQSYCFKSNILASEVLQTAKQYISFESAMKTEDSSKLMIASEIGNFAKIFENFAKNMQKTSKINEKHSKLLKESLISNLLDVKECVIIENQNGIESVAMIVPSELALKAELPVNISKLTRNRMKIDKAQHLELSGLSFVSFVPECNLGAEFSVKSKARESENGDNTVVTKLSRNKYFVAIADGMGHGEKANKISTMVLSLIKSLFEVGLDDSLIVESVNKLLIPAGLDNFTTLDACVLDLDKHSCTFIKLGATVSIIKHKEVSEVVSCESLPIGIVQSVTPTIVKKQISAGDMIFLASDGVVDSFQSVESYKWFINDAKIYDLPKYLDDVIFDVQNMNNKHPDDVTIIGIKLLKN